MSRILSWLVSLVAKFCSKSKTLWTVLKEWLGKSFASKTFGAAAGAEAGTASAAATAAESAAKGQTTIKANWFKNLFAKISANGFKRKIVPSLFSVNGMLLGLTAYQIFKDSKSGATVTNTVNVHNSLNKEFDKYDNYHDAFKSSSQNSTGVSTGEAATDALSGGLGAPMDSAFGTLNILDREKAFEALDAQGGIHFFIQGEEVTEDEFRTFVTATRIYQRFAVPMSDSTVDRWLVNSFDPDDNSEYLYEDGVFLDKSVSDLISQGTYLRTRFDHIVAPVMRQLGVGRMAELKPLMRLVQMDWDEFTAIERSLQVWS